ncbi:MAG: histidine phosphatase family protein [Actinomycetota bacterium]|nr:histidine phosphatase family protein [Rubrobacter sp.]MDQ3508543.1 histidine phosphatase family protein [Actinomycetota bacterium]
MARFFSIVLFMLFAFSPLAACGSLDNAPETTGTRTTAPESTETLSGATVSESAEGTTEAPEPPTESTEASTGTPELDAMRDGGFVIFIRHPETDASPVSADADGHLEDLSDCSLQRNLTDAGRGDARSLGEDIERLEIPVGEVLASPYCRTSETAELALGEAEAVPELATPRYLSPGDPEADERIAYLREVFSTPPAEGANTWVMTHKLNLRLVSGESVPEGGAVVFEPRGEGFEVFATLPPEWWGESP